MPNENLPRPGDRFGDMAIEHSLARNAEPERAAGSCEGALQRCRLPAMIPGVW